MKTGIELISQERQEQVQKHGYDANNDSYNKSGELASAAVYSITQNESYYPSSWSDSFKNSIDLKFSKGDYIGRLKAAGALIAAEIDRVQNDTEETKRYWLDYL